MRTRGLDTETIGWQGRCLVLSQDEVDGILSEVDRESLCDKDKMMAVARDHTTVILLGLINARDVGQQPFSKTLLSRQIEKNVSDRASRLSCQAT